MIEQDVSAGSTCIRCKTSVATLRVRNQRLCDDCFVHYVTTKAVKRLAMYKVRGSSAKKHKKFLLPLSLGPSSISLLHILNTHLHNQQFRVGSPFTEIVLMHVNCGDSAQASQHLENIQCRFTEYQFVNPNVEDALNLQNIKWNLLGLPQPDPTLSGKERLEKFLSPISEATSRVDIISTLMNLLIVDIAKRNGCDGILFGDSTTRLAEKTLTETAKGRGFSLSWQISDGPSPYEVDFFYPLRDVLKKELLIFYPLVKPPLTDLVLTESPLKLSASSKSTTINELMTQYFDSVEENYPSIVANVVRTSSKLQPIIPDGQSLPCNFCGLPVAPGTNGIYGWGGDQSLNRQGIQGLLNSGEVYLCYGCSRSIDG